MRYAFVSDIHANLQAWNAVLADIRAQRIDRLICLGDIVGYGPRPAEVLASVYRHAHEIILGNHDAVVAGKLDPGCFNDDARRMIQWTKKQLDLKAIHFFRSLPYTIEGEGFACSHADFSDPAGFLYLREESDARASWKRTEEPLLVVGHTHVPEVYLLTADDTCKHYDAVDFEMESGNRYIINTGSAGMPRDGDFRASYVIFDSTEKSVVFQRVAFDLDAFRKDVQSQIGHSDQCQ